jgi:ATP phosphoribosyltransferase
MIADISSRVIVNKAAMKTKYPVIKDIITSLEEAVSSQ